MSAAVRRLLWFVAALAVCPLAAQQQVVVEFGSDASYLANASDPGIGLDWTLPGFGDAAWPVGPYGIGYETDNGAQDLILTDVPAGSLSVYTRIHFTIEDPSAVANLVLGIDFDDGYVAWINGVEVSRSPSMPVGDPSWNSLSDDHESSNYAVPFYEWTDISAAALPELQPGDNVLALGIWNSGATSTDLVIVPRLVANKPLTVVRGPYLQSGGSDRITVRWRTDLPTDSRVLYGSQPGALDQSVTDSQPTTEHVVELQGLGADTLYVYAIGTSDEVLAGDDADHVFITPPPTGTPRPTRIWVLGDSGKGDLNAAAVRDAYYTYTGATHTNLWLMLGDNAYNGGTDAEYQFRLFDIYPEMLRKSVLWPTLGNHDGYSADSTTQSGPYYENFTLPTAAEAGGLPSGTEAYYSFDFGNVHFVVLDSYETNRFPGSVMLTWLAQDLAATTQDWIIAYWHHPPYSKGSHDSDLESELIDFRENVVPILDDHGADLTLTGHSHSYERSYLIDGVYSTPTPDFATLQAAGLILDDGDGREGGDGAYGKPFTGPDPHSGTVHTVCGCSSHLGGGDLDHPVMFLSLSVLGSMILDVNDDRLDARFLDTAGSILDSFTVLKGVGCPDPDQDGICSELDNCPDIPNPEQEDDDGDGTGNTCDPCPDDPNKTEPEICGCGVLETDSDGDLVPDCIDLCPVDPNKSDPGLCGCGVLETDSDGDGTPDCVDLCPGDSGKIDPGLCGCGVPDSTADGDGDSVPDCIDNCPATPNTDQTDSDGDGIGDVCTDSDGDGVSDLVDCAPASPGVSAAPGEILAVAVGKADGIKLTWSRGVQGHVSNVYRGIISPGQSPMSSLVCLDAENPGTESTDAEVPPSGVAFCYMISAANLCAESSLGRDSQGGDRWPPASCVSPNGDADGDGVPDLVDNCPLTPNPDQSDVDREFVGDLCDNCPTVFNATQADADKDGRGDACVGLVDRDDDGVEDGVDNCPDDFNTPQADSDSDGPGDVCDNCPNDANTSQADADQNGVGDACIWWDPTWQNRRKITFDNAASSEHLSDFPVLVTLDTLSIQTQADGRDLRFLDPENPTVELAYEIEQWVVGGTAAVWLKVPQIDAGSVTDFVWMYYDNPTASPNPLPPSDVWTNGYAAVWHMGEASGLANDSTVNANDAAFFGDLPDSRAGLIGNAQEFDGMDDYLEVADSPSLSPTTAISVQAWLKPSWTAIPYLAVIYDDWIDTGGVYAFELAIYPGGKSGISVSGSGFHDNFETHSGTSTIQLNAWNHVSGTFDSGTFNFYYNGAIDAPEFVSAAVTGIHDNAPAKLIGVKNNEFHSFPFMGLIDELRLSGVARSAAWIEAQYRSQSGTLVTVGCEATEVSMGCAP